MFVTDPFSRVTDPFRCVTDPCRSAACPFRSVYSAALLLAAPVPVPALCAPRCTLALSRPSASLLLRLDASHVQHSSVLHQFLRLASSCARQVRHSATQALGALQSSAILVAVVLNLLLRSVAFMHGNWALGRLGARIRATSAVTLRPHRRLAVMPLGCSGACSAWPFLQDPI